MLNLQKHLLPVLHPRHWKHQYLYHILVQHSRHPQLYHHQLLVKPLHLLQSHVAIISHVPLSLSFRNYKCNFCGNDDHYLVQMHHFCCFIEFLPRNSYAKRGICRRRVSVCVYVCLSHSGIVSKRLNIRSRK